MFLRLLRLLRRQNPAQDARRADVELPLLPREQMNHLMLIDEGLPQIDWGMANAWIAHQVSREDRNRSAAFLRRALAARWLDELRDALKTDSRRWRSVSIEGLAPLDGTIGKRVAACADRSLSVIGQALREIRGDPGDHPIPPIGIVVLATADEYYSFISHFYEEEGEYATSGGLYIRSSADGFPVMAINAQITQELESTIAHELTHHALRPDRPELCEGLPMWAEEGLTQMMEEHVTRQARFTFGREMLQRHRALWNEIGFDGFAAGETFHSPHGEEQELSYNLSEALTRSLATTRQKDFFAFARACRNEGQNHEGATREHLRGTVQELAEALVWGRTPEVG